MLRSQKPEAVLEPGTGTEDQDMNAEGYRSVERQIGYCGIWCGSCIVGNGALRELSRTVYFSVISDAENE